jgi:hypothetical protein
MHAEESIQEDGLTGLYSRTCCFHHHDIRYMTSHYSGLQHHTVLQLPAFLMTQLQGYAASQPSRPLCRL